MNIQTDAPTANTICQREYSIRALINSLKLGYKIIQIIIQYFTLLNLSSFIHSEKINTYSTYYRLSLLSDTSDKYDEGIILPVKRLTIKSLSKDELKELKDYQYYQGCNRSIHRHSHTLMSKVIVGKWKSYTEISQQFFTRLISLATMKTRALEA